MKNKTNFSQTSSRLLFWCLAILNVVSVLCNVILKADDQFITAAPQVISFESYKDWSSRLTSNQTSLPKTTLLLLEESKDVRTAYHDMEPSASSTQKTIVKYDEPIMFATHAKPNEDQMNAHNFAAQVLSKFAYISPLLSLPSTLNAAKTEFIQNNPIIELNEKPQDKHDMNKAMAKQNGKVLTLDSMNEIDDDEPMERIKADRKSASAISFPSLTSTTVFDMTMPSTTLNPMLSDMSTTNLPLDVTFSNFPLEEKPQNYAPNHRDLNLQNTHQNSGHNNDPQSSPVIRNEQPNQNVADISSGNVQDIPADVAHDIAQDMLHDSSHYIPHDHSHDPHDSHADDDDHGSSEEPEDYDDDEELESFRYPVRVNFHDADDDPISVQDTSTPQFMIPSIDLGNIKQKGCKTIVKEVQAIPVENMDQKQGEQTNVKTRVRRNTDRNGRKYTSIVMTKECHFPGDEVASSEESPQRALATDTNPNNQFQYNPRIEKKYDAYDPDFDFKPKLKYPSVKLPANVDYEMRPKPSNNKRKYVSKSNNRKAPDYSDDSIDTFDSDTAFYDSRDFMSPHHKNSRPKPVKSEPRELSEPFEPPEPREPRDHREDRESHDPREDRESHDPREDRESYKRREDRESPDPREDDDESYKPREDRETYKSREYRERDIDSDSNRNSRDDEEIDTPKSRKAERVHDSPRVSRKSRKENDSMRSKSARSDHANYDSLPRMGKFRADYTPISKSILSDFDDSPQLKSKLLDSPPSRSQHTKQTIKYDKRRKNDIKNAMNSKNAKNARKIPMYSKEVSNRDTKNRKRGKRKPKKVNRSFAFFRRNEPKEKDPNENDYAVSFGRGNFQSYSEDYDSDRDGPRPPKPVRIRRVE